MAARLAGGIRSYPSELEPLSISASGLQDLAACGACVIIAPVLKGPIILYENALTFLIVLDAEAQSPWPVCSPTSATSQDS
jgi:hypothetical protein